MDTTFTYAIGDRVTTPFGEPAIVKMAAVDAGGTQYFVTLPGGNEAWFFEGQLTGPDEAATPADLVLGETLSLEPDPRMDKVVYLLTRLVAAQECRTEPIAETASAPAQQEKAL